MNEIVGAVVAIVIVAAVAFIGLGIVELTYSQVNTTAPSDTLDSFHTNIGTVFSTLGGMLPIVVLALIGGLAIFYILSYLGKPKE